MTAKSFLIFRWPILSKFCTLKIRGIGNWITESAAGPILLAYRYQKMTKLPLIAG